MSGETPDAQATRATAADEQALSAAIRFEKGNPSAADVAAIVTVLAAASSAVPAEDAAPQSLWGDPRERLRRQYFNGPNAFTSQTPLFWTKGS